MRVHHLNCGCMCPVGGALFDGYSGGLTACLVCHCLLIETDTNGLILVDTGFGQRDIQTPERLSGSFVSSTTSSSNIASRPWSRYAAWVSTPTTCVISC